VDRGGCPGIPLARRHGQPRPALKASYRLETHTARPRHLATPRPDGLLPGPLYMAAVSSSLQAGQADPLDESHPRSRRIGESRESPRHRFVPLGDRRRREFLMVGSKLRLSIRAAIGILTQWMDDHFGGGAGCVDLRGQAGRP
jgi:hypothetical protein